MQLDFCQKLLPQCLLSFAAALPLAAAEKLRSRSAGKTSPYVYCEYFLDRYNKTEKKKLIPL